MPILAVAYIAIAAGLLLGFGGALFPAVVIAGALALVSAWRRSASSAALAAMFGAATLLAGTVRDSDEDCARGIVARGSATVRLHEPLQARTSARGTVIAAGCRVPARVRFRAGGAPAGALVVVSGDVRRNARGLAVTAREMRIAKPPGILARSRARAGAAIDRLYGAHAPLAKALLIADEGDIAPEVRRQFADAGIIHMVSVSGLHVAVLAEAVVLVFLIAGMRLQRAESVAVGVTALFVLFVGAPAPAVRSGAMYAAVIASRRLQRPTSPWALLALGAALPLVDPRLVYHIGYQLSVVGMAALVASSMLTRRLALESAPWASRLIRELLATIIASAVTAPIVAWHFGRLSLAAPVTNLAAAPLFGLAQPALFLSLAVAPLGSLAQFVADGTGVLLAAIERVARVGASLPGAAIDVMPSFPTAIAIASATVALLVACVARRWPRPLLVGGCAINIGVWWPLFAPDVAGVELHVLDVGQGDAIALRTPARRWIVVDAGDAWQTGDAGARIVAPFLRHRGGDVAALILSHPHRDHIGGAASLFRLLRVESVYDGGFVQSSAGYEELLEAVRARNVPWRVARAGDVLKIDGVSLAILAPDSTTATSAGDANEASVVVLVEYRGVRILLTGDAELAEEEQIVQDFGERLGADVLKVGHHGSSTSSSGAFLDRVRPRLGLVSVGADNHYGHPSPDVIASLEARGTQVLRTDHVGSIAIYLDGRRIRIRTNDGSWELVSHR